MRLSAANGALPATAEFLLRFELQEMEACRERSGIQGGFGSLQSARRIVQIQQETRPPEVGGFQCGVDLQRPFPELQRLLLLPQLFQ